MNNSLDQSRYSIYDDIPTTIRNLGKPNFTKETAISEKAMTQETIFYVTVGVFGLLGNGFAMLVIATDRKMRSKICNFFILNQSVIDLLGSFFLTCNNPAIVRLEQPPNWIAAQLYCRFWASSYFMWAMFETSTFNLVAITIERYAEVVHPFSYPQIFTRTRAKVALALVWVTGILFPMIINAVPSPPGLDGICMRYGGWPNSLPLQLFMEVTFLVVLLLGPVCVMMFCYTRMLFVLKARVSPTALDNLSASEKAREERRGKARRNLMKTLVTVSIAFFLCWVSNNVYGFLANVGVRGLGFSGTFYHFTVYMVFINCVVNPIIYTAQYKEFQNAAKAILFCIRRTENDGNFSTA